jgi:hypothetical protein
MKLEISPLNSFFKNKENLIKLIAILDKKYAVRVIEHFILVFARKHNIVYEVDGKIFDIYGEYKNMATSMRKKNFDLFRRKQKIKLKYTLDGRSGHIETTHSQLNFYRWAIENELFVQIDKYYEDVKVDLASTQNLKLSQLLIIGVDAQKPFTLRIQ